MSDDKTLQQTRVSEFLKFDSLLMSGAPKDFVPWYFPVKANGKDPDGYAITSRAPKDCKPEQRSSWKAPHARLSVEEAVQRLQRGENVGIAARANDSLIIYDKDSPTVLDKIETLGSTSRKRIGGHSFGFCDEQRSAKNNIPTDLGEVRSCDQYVLAPGSFVPTTEVDYAMSDVKIKKITQEDVDRALADPQLGLYTVSKAVKPAIIGFEDLPDVFIQERKKDLQEEERISKIPEKSGVAFRSRSRLFDLTVSDIFGKNLKSSVRTGHPDPIHGSTTDANFSMNKGGTLGTCWRCDVSFNAIQLLVILSGYKRCKDSGVPHHGGGSKLRGDTFALFKAWAEGKKRGLIPSDDPMPTVIFRYFKNNSVPVEASRDYRRAYDAYLARGFK